MKYAAPTELGISFRGGFYNYAAPLALEWVLNAVEHANTSQTAVWDSVAGAQDFAGTIWDFAGGVRISRETSGISRAEVRILRERFRTTRAAHGFRGSRADLAGTRQDFAGGQQDFPGASRNVAGTTWDLTGTAEIFAKFIRVAAAAAEVPPGKRHSICGNTFTFSGWAGIYFIKKLLADAGGFCIVVFDFLPI